MINQDCNITIDCLDVLKALGLILKKSSLLKSHIFLIFLYQKANALYLSSVYLIFRQEGTLLMIDLELTRKKALFHVSHRMNFHTSPTSPGTARLCCT